MVRARRLVLIQSGLFLQEAQPALPADVMRAWMADFLLELIVLITCAVIGYPLTRLLPRGRDLDRLIAAPVMGFACVCSLTILCYKLGALPEWSLWITSAIGAGVTTIEVLRTRPSLPARKTGALTASAVAVIVLCLLPGWIGGDAFKVFQGNVYDQFYSYLNGSVVFHQYSYAAVMSARDDPNTNPVVAEARNAAVNRPISIVHAAFVGTHITAVSSAYAFLAALQLQLFFSALFVVTSVFNARFRTGIAVAVALSIGFFAQYIVDIDAWSELSVLPISLLGVGALVLMTEFRPDDAADSSLTLWKSATLYAVFIVPITLIYPEAWGVYGVAAVALLVAVARRSWARLASTVPALSIAAGSALLLGLWYGSLSFITVSLQEAFTSVDWWRYFQAYALGPTGIAGPSLDQAWPIVSSPWFVRPVDMALSIGGWFWFLPGPAVSPLLAAVWRLGLYAFLWSLLSGIGATAVLVVRGGPPRAVRATIFACTAGLIVPLGFLAAGLLRTAGKALSIASPLLFLLVAAPLLLQRQTRRGSQLAAGLFVIGHLITGLIRPVLAADGSGSVLSGLPQSASLIASEKSGVDWRMERLASKLKTCHRVMVDVQQPFLNEAVQLVVTDIAVPWSSTQPVSKPDVVGVRTRPPYQPPGWESADCIVTDNRLDRPSGRQVFSLIADDETFRFVDADTGTLEIGVAEHPGVVVHGAYPVERRADGALRWTSAVTTFRLPNSVEFPATSLILTCWPIGPPDVVLRITINGRFAFDGPVPREPIALSLAPAFAEDTLEVQLSTSPVTHFPGDSRDLGVALRRLEIDKGIRPLVSDLHERHSAVDR